MLKKILIPVDFADNGNWTEEVLLLAAELGRVLPAELALVHVLSMPDLAADFPEAFEGRTFVDQEKMEKLAMERLNKIIAAHPSLTMKPYVRIGPVAHEICKAAEEIQADLVLIPTHGRSGMARFFLGSVAEHVIRDAPCHVLSFRPPKATP